MKSELARLNLLIEELRKECYYLKQEVNFCIYDGDFAGAEGFQRALALAEDKLNVLENLRDPQFSQKESLMQSIRILASSDHQRNSNVLGRYREFEVQWRKRQIEKSERELSLLNEPPKELKRSALLREYVDLLAERTINKLKLCFFDDQVSVELRVIEERFQLDIRSQSDRRINSFLSYRALIELRKIGFKFSESNDVYSHNKFNLNDTELFFQALSRVFFDAFKVFGGREVRLHVS
ncbi:MAG: hypothetical protein AAF519_06640 [Bacteroidota bacterium]